MAEHAEEVCVSRGLCFVVDSTLRKREWAEEELKKMIRKAKRKLEKDLARKAKKNPKKFFSYMKSISMIFNF